MRGLNQHFWHQTVLGSQVEQYISQQAGIDLDRVFEQYLRTTMIPVFEYSIEGTTLRYRWANVVDGFDMPVDVNVRESGYTRLRPTGAWQSIATSHTAAATVRVDPDFYVTIKPLVQAPREK